MASAFPSQTLKDTKILIADDNATDRKLLRVQLEKVGHEIRESTDGKEALALLAGEEFDALISDILMPNLDGYGVDAAEWRLGDGDTNAVDGQTAHFEAL